MKPYKFRPEKMKERMAEIGLNNNNLIKLCGFSVSAINRIAKNGNPTAETIGIIAAALGVRPGYFFERD